MSLCNALNTLMFLSCRIPEKVTKILQVRKTLTDLQILGCELHRAPPCLLAVIRGERGEREERIENREGREAVGKGKGREHCNPPLFPLPKSKSRRICYCFSVSLLVIFTARAIALQALY